jgi:hypothetical protein
MGVVEQEQMKLLLVAPEGYQENIAPPVPAPT